MDLNYVEPGATVSPEETAERSTAALRAAGFAPIAHLCDLDGHAVKPNPRLSLGMECLDRFLWELPPAIEPISKLGIGTVRLQSGWARTEKEKGVYDWSAMDSEVDSLLAVGIRPWVCLCYGNPIYYPNVCETIDGRMKNMQFMQFSDSQTVAAGGIGLMPLDSEEVLAGWLRYTEALVKRYRGKVTRYEVWNEPNVKVFFPKAERWTEDYAEVLRLTSKVIRAADPSASVIACTGAYRDFAPLLDRGMADYADEYSFHSYSPLPEQQDDTLRTALRAVRDARAPKLKLLRGEAGCPSRNAVTGALNKMTTSDVIQAKWITRHIVADLADPALSMTSYFHAYEFLHFSRHHHYYYGVLRQDYSRKPSFCALQVVAHLLDASSEPAPDLSMRVTACLDGSHKDDELLRCRTKAFRRNGNPVFAYWYGEELRDDSPVFRAGAEFFPVLPWENPVVIDPLSGNVYEVPKRGAGGLTLPVTGHGLFLAEAGALRDLLPDLAFSSSGVSAPKNEQQEHE